MADYLVSRRFELNQQVPSRPFGSAIAALQQANVRLEQELPRQQAVPAYEQPKREDTQARAAVHR